MTHIFISYAKKDTKSLAMDLAENLNALENVSAWVDVEGIDYGDEWETLIQRQIARCDYMVVLYSPDINRHIDDESQTESYVIKEIRYAQMRKKPIIPVMVQETEPPMSLISIQYIDYVNEGISSSELVNRLCKRMKITSTPKAGVVSVALSKPQIAIPPKPKTILPDPFDWCYIKSGQITLIPHGSDSNLYIRQDTIVDVPAFWMSKYAITNRQYRDFITDSGYQNDKFWTVAGINWRNQSYIQKPKSWDNVKFNGDDDNNPVAGVSWYEAVAFCRWLSLKSGQNIMLPTDSQWQRAAQGDDNRDYPWGKGWRQSSVMGELMLNSAVDFSSNGTVPVDWYDKFCSPFGVVNMAGNIWELCTTTYSRGENELEGYRSRIARGGSWRTISRDSLKTTYRLRISPDDSDDYRNDIGFRISCHIDPT